MCPDLQHTKPICTEPCQQGHDIICPSQSAGKMQVMIACGAASPARSLLYSCICSAEDDPKEGSCDRITGCSNCLIHPQKAVNFTQEVTCLFYEDLHIDFASMCELCEQLPFQVWWNIPSYPIVPSLNMGNPSGGDDLWQSKPARCLKCDTVDFWGTQPLPAEWWKFMKSCDFRVFLRIAFAECYKWIQCYNISGYKWILILI